MIKINIANYRPISFVPSFFKIFQKGYIYKTIHHHKHQGLDPLIRSLSRVTTALANVSSVFQLFSFLVVCSDMISKGFSLVAFFASVKASSVCIHLSCLVCIQSVVHGVRSRLFSAASILRLCKFVRVQFSDPYKNVGKTKVLYIFKIVSIPTFLKIVLSIVPINCKNFANLNSTSLENWYDILQPK